MNPADSSLWAYLRSKFIFATCDDPEWRAFTTRHKIQMNREILKIMTALVVLNYLFGEKPHEKISVAVFSAGLLFIFTKEKIARVLDWITFVVALGSIWLRLFLVSELTMLYNQVYSSISILAIIIFTRSYRLSILGLIFILAFHRLNGTWILSQCISSPEFAQDMIRYLISNSHIITLVIFGFGHALTFQNNTILYQLWSKHKEWQVLYQNLQTKDQTLQELSKSKTKLLLSLSHEFRNPINAALGNLELANDRTNDMTVKEHLTNCKVSIEVLFHLVSNLLDSNKLEAGILELNPLRKSSKAMFFKVWEIVKNLLDKKNLLGEFYIHKSIPKMVNVDPHFVIKILLNLVLNAIKYTSQGAVMTVITWLDRTEISDDMLQPSQLFYANFLKMTDKAREINVPEISERSQQKYQQVYCSKSKEEIDIPSENLIDMRQNLYLHQLTRNTSIEGVEIYHSVLKQYEKLTNKENLLPLGSRNLFENNSATEISSNKKGFLKIEVYDSGCGMDYQAVKDNLFQRFSSNIADRDQRLGVGLGLWLTEGLCKFMGGQIRASSQKDKGSQFIALLPIEASEAPKPQQLMQTLSPSYIASIQLTALVVDDDKYNREINIAFLKKVGVLVKGEAENGEEAVRLFTAKPSGYFDLIVLDLEMPVMNGKEAARKIREFEKSYQRSHANIIIATGNCDLCEYAACMDGDGNIRADFFFRKPLIQKDVEGFVNVIRQEKALKSSCLDKRIG